MSHRYPVCSIPNCERIANPIGLCSLHEATLRIFRGWLHGPEFDADRARLEAASGV
jgi:hypothetical protein